MIFDYAFNNVMLLVISYFIIYNITSFILFYTILQLISIGSTNLFSFSNLNSSSFFSKVVSLSILSMAGVPPFIGFFSKIFVLVLISNSFLFTLFTFLFIFLLTSLYFYVQNLRFINSMNKSTSTFAFELNPHVNILYINTAIIISFILIFGFTYMEDIFLIST